MSNWEGGIRGNSFASGGFLPEAVRGTKFDGLTTIWDWYGTFASLAGVDPTDHRAAAAGLPKVDSYDLTEVLLNGPQAQSPRTTVVVGTEPRPSNLTAAPACSSYSNGALTHGLGGFVLPAPAPLPGNCTSVSGLIVDERRQGGGLWKLITGDLAMNFHQGPKFPNSSTNIADADYDGFCHPACLYNIGEDPLENDDKAKGFQQRVANMTARLNEEVRKAFNPHRGTDDPAACKAVHTKYGGFWGPFLP